MGQRMIPCTVLVAGVASGQALASDIPISLWGGLNPDTGEVIDRRHPLSGEVVTGRWLVVPQGRGSCSASGVLFEAICNDVGPIGIMVSQTDPVLGFGAILADELHGRTVPVLLIGEEDRRAIPTGAELQFDGRILTISPS